MPVIFVLTAPSKVTLLLVPLLLFPDRSVKDVSFELRSSARIALLLIEDGKEEKVLGRF